jgi:hypothetical protein
MDEAVMIHRAREAIARGDRETARQLLAQALREQPNSEMAWMMMSTLVDQPDRKRDCLERVLRINPRNDAARERLAELEAPEVQAEIEPVPLPEPPEGAPLTALEAEPVASPEPEPAPVASKMPAGTNAAAPPADSPDAPCGAAPKEGPATPSGPDAVAAEETTSEAAPAAPSPDSGDELPPTEPATGAETTPSSQPASAPAAGAGDTGAVPRSSFLTDSLVPGERVMHRTALTPWVFSRPVAVVLGAVIVLSLPGGDLQQSIVLVCGGGFLVLALAYFGLRAIRYFGSEYVVTDRRVLAKRGLLARLTLDIPLLEIEEVKVRRSLPGGSSGPGNVWIRRTDGTQTVFWRIRQPGAFCDAVERGRGALVDPVGS